jgi:hypothetical protein
MEIGEFGLNEFRTAQLLSLSVEERLGEVGERASK